MRTRIEQSKFKACKSPHGGRWKSYKHGWEDKRHVRDYRKPIDHQQQLDDK